MLETPVKGKSERIDETGPWSTQERVSRDDGGIKDHLPGRNEVSSVRNGLYLKRTHRQHRL